MKHIILICIYLIVLPFNANASDHQSRLKAAEEYEKVIPITTLMDSMVEQLKKDPIIKRDPELLEIMYDAMDVEKIRQSTINLMAESFTLEELEALTEFYKTDAGQSVYKKMPTYMTKAMPLIQSEVAKGVIALKAELQKRKK